MDELFASQQPVVNATSLGADRLAHDFRK